MIESEERALYLASLPPEAQARWPWAMDEYARIQRENAIRLIAAMTPEQRQAEEAAIPPGEGTLEERVIARVGLSGGKAGSRSSALFTRLLTGKAALPTPPPLSFCYPWYEVVESADPLEVLLQWPAWLDQASCGAVIEGKEKSKARPETAPPAERLAINQEGWIVVDCNEAACELMRLNLRHFRGGAGKNTLQPDAMEAILACYLADPIITVTHPGAGVRMLRLGSSVTGIYRKHALDDLAKLAGRQSQTFGPGIDAFSAGAFCIAATIGNKIAAGTHPAERHQREMSRIQGDSFMAHLERHCTPPPTADEIRSFEEDPSAYDTVEFVRKVWFLTKPEA